jgi:hypothetical protein
VSVKDRWVGPREHVLNIPITCWRYGPSKPSSMSSTDAWFCPHCLIGWLGRETGYGPMDRSAGVMWIVSGALFLESSSPAQLCRRLVKGYQIRKLPVERICRTYVDWRGKRTCHVDRVFPYRVYINSNHCNSRIWVSLVCDSHHVDNLMAWIMT